VAIVRAKHSAVYPTRFTLLAATNPCPCGYLGEGDRCRCGEGDLARHRRRLSGPLLDRIDLVAHVERPERRELSEPPPCSSAGARERVVQARERQTARLRGEGVCVNAHMDARMLRRHLALSRNGERLVREIQDQRLLSVRGLHRLLRVARTAADLQGSAGTCERHVCTALSLRTQDGLSSRRAA
jgi:magnesium chelatase family protein